MGADEYERRGFAVKANNGTGNIADRDEWETDQELWETLHDQYGFSFDCCANKNNAKTPLYSNDFLAENGGILTGWMNPPFSKALSMFEHFFKIVVEGVAIYRCDNMETNVWQDVIFKNADWVFIPKGRIKYNGLDGKRSRFPSALIGFGVPPPKNMTGVTMVIKEASR